MGLEKTIRRMNKQHKRLYETLISVGVIVMITYIAFILVVDLHLDFMQLFGHPVLYTGIMVFLLLGIAWKILHGGNIKYPKNLMTEDQEYQKKK